MLPLNDDEKDEGQGDEVSDEDDDDKTCALALVRVTSTILLG